MHKNAKHNEQSRSADTNHSSKFRKINEKEKQQLRNISLNKEKYILSPNAIQALVKKRNTLFFLQIWDTVLIACCVWNLLGFCA